MILYSYNFHENLHCNNHYRQESVEEGNVGEARVVVIVRVKDEIVRQHPGEG